MKEPDIYINFQKMQAIVAQSKYVFSRGRESKREKLPRDTRKVLG
jgi:hypothetical protein